MRSKANTCIACLALTLAATAAIMSTPGQPEGTYEILQFLLSTAAPEAAAMAGAIGENPDSLLPP